MNIIVQKFGGTSVSTEERRKQVIKKIGKAIENGFKPVVVVSAMGRMGEPYATDTLLSLVDSNFKNNNKSAQDLLMCCGEIISSVVLCNDLYKHGITAVPLTGGQAGIITNEVHTDAQAIDVDTHNIIKILEAGKVPVVTGFQGVTRNGFFTTLGRGGSDTSACILGVALKAKEIDIYTDVDGIMTADPRMVEDASLINEMTYNEVFQLADQGAKVIHPKAVALAKKGNVPLVIKNTMNDSKGTVIKSNVSEEEKRLISGITHLNNRIQVRVRLSENKGKSSYRSLLELLAKNHISLDLINIFPEHQMFTIDSSEKDKLSEIMSKADIKYTTIEECSTIAVVGAGMNGVPGVMARIINTLTSNEIEILQTTDSNMTIWCLIYTKKVPDAIRLLHKEFGLGK
ncbi:MULTISPECIES: aspartate kinase [unclassified Clostridium]|uniref:aspartate kinase n=1 Tax=Clostridium TaxID=1485 RepID=UPI001C8B1333|nr:MULTISPECIES: aspartate kinase [unclassified Clostridium]MBX9135963.1 aspartate kinase [Clostridium sp. K12(2020)]MBX9142693.1 aspartate kinase [Clostridium sp. K13]MDU2289497.1 aspartate kinase [Clostridium celatum]MDU4326544.1 aspartate kinase [Clostridium celatum]